MSDKTGDGLTSDNGGAKVNATWTSDTTITIYFDSRTEVRKQEPEINGIKASYEQISD